ncbi:MAG: class I SAM-dependent DNA methyltransferase [Candidatus Tectomicrobia bacterium]|uniref:site-specific DNA-methyltransferase (adenine-specific) n=1 Tax=Tectimicrobiota bacterium TaxID=2528274 RepID=A0A932ZUK1_UNCTE|nr:class I SAM-dependent DNA methyltransferase [Candidatus Tectomicrobia bacterium]
MTPREFVDKWKAMNLRESAASQSHFNDLCALLDEPTPTGADPEGTWYTFEKGAQKTGGGDGWADVWKRHHFAWEYKGKRKDLDAAFAQLQKYAIALENPPLLVVSDMETIRVHTNFTNTIQRVHALGLDDLLNPEKLRLLKWAFAEPGRLKPGETREDVTRAAAEEFAGLAQDLRKRGFEPQRVAHFLNKIVFCMFAEDIGILPHNLFTRFLETASQRTGQFEDMARGLFGAMKDGGYFGVDHIEWFNGGLFDDTDVLPLEPGEIRGVLKVCRLNWSDIEPSIFGTLFERGLDPGKRGQLGAHYTDQGKIMLIVEPVVLAPLRREWEEARDRIGELMAKAAKGGTPAARTRNRNLAREMYRKFLDRLEAARVLDPACGSGNFLYLALLGLKDIEHQANLEAQVLGVTPEFSRIARVGPQCVRGIEINSYAAELARVTIWIGQIQWMLRHGFGLDDKPILKPLDQIECRDAVLNPDGTEAEWPEAEFIVGNPPFLGNKRMIGGLGEEYTKRLREAYEEKVPAGADYVTYWIEKARGEIETGRVKRAGLVATNSIRGGDNRKVLDRIRETGTIFNAWSDEPWVVDGAAVRVSLVCFEKESSGNGILLDGKSASEIYSDLTAAGDGTSEGINLTQAMPLTETKSVSFMGTTKGGAFNVPGELARSWLVLPSNPNGKFNGEVVRPWTNGQDITGRSSDSWVVDFGCEMPESEAALFEAPFQYVTEHVKAERMKNRRESYRRFWWRHVEPRSGMREAFQNLKKVIVTPRVAKHRLFVWIPVEVLPDSAVIAIARDDDTTFGVLHSRFHECWSLRLGTWLGVGNDPRYTPSTTFETFPFPEGLTPDIPAEKYASDPRAGRIAGAARRLNELRESWLDPPDMVRRVPEVAPGYPDRVLPVDGAAAKLLKKRTLTNLYNERPAWLDHAHRELDEAVAAAYGWEADLPEEEVLRRLLALNQARGKKA